MKVKEWEKRSTVRGDWNKKRIFDIISESFIEGLSFMEIKERAELSKPTVTRCLSALINEGRIQKVNQRYFVKRLFDDDGLTLYGLFFKSFAPECIFLRKPSGELEFGPHSEIEEFISEFSKRIGSYISYVFTEALRQQKIVKPISIRSQIANDFVRQAIPLDSFLAFFRDMVPREKEDRKYGWELGTKSYNRISTAFHSLYPETWELIEKTSSEFIDVTIERLSPEELGNNCDHIWNRIYIAKKGQYLICKRCPAILKA